MTDLTAKLREALPCLGSPSNDDGAYTECRVKRAVGIICLSCHARAKVEAAVREMVAKVPHLFRGNEPERYLIAAAVCPFPAECARIGGQCALGGEKGTNNG